MAEHNVSEITTTVGYLLAFIGGVLLYIAGGACIFTAMIEMIRGCEYLYADVFFALLVVYIGIGLRAIGLIIE